jgi:putative ABC transport system permease protein
MLRNYFKLAWRNLINNKLYSFLNIGGLSVGICVCMLIMVYVAHDMSFDRFHKNAGRIFYPVMNLKIGDNEESIDRMSYESAQIVKNADPAIESFLRMQQITDNKVIENINSPAKKFTEKKIFVADGNFFDFFSFHLIDGNPNTVLSRPFTMVISQRAAQKYFGKENAVGKLLKYDAKYIFEVTGIAENAPSNSSIDFDFIGSASSYPAMNSGQSATSGIVEPGEFRTFLLLKDAEHANATAALIQTLSENAHDKFSIFKYGLNALVNRHKDYDEPGNIEYRKIFPLVAVLILFLALINYMSLATARSAIRSKEIGVRKVLGANRGKIVKQFYVESTLYALIAFILAVTLFTAVRPAFYNLLQLKIDDTFLYSPYALGIFASLLVVTIFISGSYPSLVLSSFSPVKVLYGRLGKQKAASFIRKTFTVIQFSISVALIISSIIINRQLYFLRHMDTGMQREQVIMIPYQKELNRHHLAFKKSIENLPGIEKVATAAAPIFGGIDMTNAHPKDSKLNIFVSELYVDQTFVNLLGLKWEIPPASDLIPGMKGQILINEEAANKLNLPADPIGQQLVIGRDSVTVCAVLKNFNYSSLHNKIDALCIFVINETDSSWVADNGDCLFAKINPHTNIPTLLESIRNVYDRFDKTTPFEYHFLDDAFEAQFRAEDRLSKIFDVFTVITIFIACMGLFGLAAFSAAQRTKEIGIRKVLGADTISIITLISFNFIKLVLISIIIAIPLAWISMDNWLQGFPYRTNIGLWIFVIAAISTILIALATVSFQAIKAAVANPVKNLRTE